MQEIRCKACNKLYGKAHIFVGVIRCSRCKLLLEYKIYTNDIYIGEKSGTINIDPAEDNS